MDERISDEELSELIYNHRDSRHVSPEQTLECRAFNELYAYRQHEASARLTAEELVERIRGGMEDMNEEFIFIMTDSEAAALLAEHLGRPGPLAETKE